MNGRVRRTLLLASLFSAAWPLSPAGAGGGCHGAGPEMAQTVRGTDVEMVGNCFRPGILAVDPGATVRFTNNDEIPHIVSGTGWGTYHQIAPGDTVQHQFPERGTYPYTCYLHPGMNGAIVVGDAAAAPATALAASSTPTADPDLHLLAFGGLAGLVFGAAAGRRLRFGRRPGQPAAGGS